MGPAARQDPSAQRINRLQKTVHYASWWMMGQGLLFVIMGHRMANFFKLRFDDGLIPYQDIAGLGLLCLGLFSNRAIREASKQYLAVDTLTLYFTGLSAMTLYHRLSGFPLFWFEWASLAVNIGLGGALIAFRTKGEQMDMPGSLVALDVKDAWGQAQGLAKGWRGSAGSTQVRVDPRVPVAPQVPVAPVAEAPVAPGMAETKAVAAEPEKPKTISQAMPHMD